jgi:hypothetical protein
MMVNGILAVFCSNHHRALLENPQQIATLRARRFLKAGLKRADVGYRRLAERLNKHGLEETEVTITGKLARGAFSAAFLLACLTVLGLEGVRLEDL